MKKLCALLLIAMLLLSISLTVAAKSPTPKTLPITGPVVGQYFGIFEGTTPQFQAEVNAQPFDKVNLLLIAFVHTYLVNGKYVVGYENANGHTDDAARIDYTVKVARQKNPNIKILLSLGWGKNDAGNAAETPVDFANSVKQMVTTHNLDGFDIDYEGTSISGFDNAVRTQKFTALATDIRNVLPGKIFTLTPAQTSYLDSNNIKIFDYVMPQTYATGGNGTTALPYAQLLGTTANPNYANIVYGINIEDGNSITPNVTACKTNKAAGVFGWRLGNASETNLAVQMWNAFYPNKVKNLK